MTKDVITSPSSLSTCGCIILGPRDLHMTNLLKCSLTWSSSTNSTSSLLQTFPLVSGAWDPRLQTLWWRLRQMWHLVPQMFLSPVSLSYSASCLCMIGYCPMSSQVACLYFHLLYASFSHLIFAKNLLFIQVSCLCMYSGISARFAACWDRPLLSLKGVILQYEYLLGPIFHPGPYVKRLKSTLLLMNYMIP